MILSTLSAKICFVENKTIESLTYKGNKRNRLIETKSTCLKQVFHKSMHQFFYQIQERYSCLLEPTYDAILSFHNKIYLFNNLNDKFELEEILLSP